MVCIYVHKYGGHMYIHISLRINLNYRKVGKFGKFGKSSMICQTKTIQISIYKYNLLAESIHLPNYFSPNAQNE